jgi:uncharacterized protein
MKRENMLDLNDALQHPGRIIAVDISTELPEMEDIDLVTPIEGFLEAVSTGNQLLIEGEFSTKCMMECSRCGAAIEQEVHCPLDEQFNVEGIPSQYAQADYARVVSDEPYPLFDENNLLVEELLQQALVLNLPVQPLCDHGWDGDCPNATAEAKLAREKQGAPGLGQLSVFLQEEPE